MIKTIRRVSLVLVALLVVVFAARAVSASEGRELKNVSDVYDVSHYDTELVNIYKATLKYKGKTQDSDIYYVVCRGLDVKETDMSKPRSLASAIKIILSVEDNAYVKAVVNAVTSTIKSGSKVIFAGHSLGGMVIQQVIANDTIKNNYNVLNTLSIGTPYIITENSKEGKLIRAVDNLDPVALVSIASLANPFVGEVKTETSFKLGLVHFKSYDEGACWDKYDALGNYKGKGKQGYSIVLNSILLSLDADGNSRI